MFIGGNNQCTVFTKGMQHMLNNQCYMNIRLNDNATRHVSPNSRLEGAQHCGTHCHAERIPSWQSSRQPNIYYLSQKYAFVMVPSRDKSEATNYSLRNREINYKILEDKIRSGPRAYNNNYHRSEKSQIKLRERSISGISVSHE